MKEGEEDWGGGATLPTVCWEGMLRGWTGRGKECASGGPGRTEEYLQGVGMQLQVLGLLLHHVHVLRALIVEAVHAGVGQHLREPESAFPC